MTATLLWKPLGDGVLFIFAITSRGPLVLMSSALPLSPTPALELYGVRTRLEIRLDVLKNRLGAFGFRFWTKKRPRHPRRPTANRSLKAPLPPPLPTVEMGWHAYEPLVLGAVMAPGLLPLIALRFDSRGWPHHTLSLRTPSRPLPSEKTVKQGLTPLLSKHLAALAQNSLIQKIQRYFAAPDEDPHDDHRWVA